MNKKSFLFFTIIFIEFAVFGQVNMNVFTGFANYQGDLQEKPFTLNQAGFAAGLGLSYEISEHINLRGGITYGKIKADDKKGKKNIVRNLNFSSPVTELNLCLEYQLLSLYNHKISPYVFAGIAYFRFNPSTQDITGKKVYLQPLSTEGQGFYKDRKVYSLNQFSIPFGGGIRMNVSNTVTLGVELGMRKTSTDYLDDVSTTYIDENILFNNRAQLAVDMAYRGYELPTGSPIYPADGTQRGSPKNKDWYYFGGITIGFRLNPKDENGFNASKSQTGCPKIF